MSSRSPDARALKPFGADGDVLNSVLDDRYKIEHYVGASNGAEVYDALDMALKKSVVVKVLRPRFLVGEDFGARLRQEYEIFKSFDHPHVAKVLTFNQTADGAVYFIREHLPGVTLAELVKRQGPVDVARLSVMLNQIASALDAVHEAQIIHRDICPDNIHIARDADGNDLVKIVNFGLAKALGELPEAANDALLSGAAVVQGSASTVSPEVAAGDKYSQLADVYSLGAVLYFALVGKMPFEAKTPNALIVAHLTQAPPKLADRESTVWVPENVEALVLKALAKKPHQRPQSALDLADLFCEAVGRFRGKELERAPASSSRKRPTQNRQKAGASAPEPRQEEEAPAPVVSYTPDRAKSHSAVSPIMLLMSVVAVAVVALFYTMRS